MGLIDFLKEKFHKKDKNVDKYSQGMAKSRQNFSNRLDLLSRRYKTVNQEYFDELEQILIESDVGVNLVIKIVDEVLEKSRQEKITNPQLINELLVDRMFVGYAEKGDIKNEITFKAGEATVVLVVGVNGVGKTTSIAKLAYRYIHHGKKVLLVAADTFRAGAVEQLTVWAQRLNCEIVTGAHQADPASVAYDGMKKAREINADLVIVDTAGRLQTKTNLMMELSKIKRVLGREIEGAPQETFLIIDATTGQNGVVQAKAFAEVTDLTGVIVTKMDGTSKGGIILAIRDEFKVPVRFIGLGEKMDDLEEFDLDKYLYGLCVGE
ncbi:MAG: signal recognition particle-docking protein FtsY [Erysipelotrichaceae bacterium]|jgi:fused signal recognition particle receptor|nr:signal recognition particle-docking protein FtsY [Bacilli bacterium]NLV28959.1 signal recognition particle-docking protein FtsY [Erysipelotrichaceae bacterium]